MGSAISAARDVVRAGADLEEKAAMNQLSSLEELARTKVAQKRAELQAQVAVTKYLPPDVFMDEHYGYYVNASSDSLGQVEGVLDDLFAGNFLDGLKGIVKTAAKNIMATSKAGAAEETHYFVAFLNDAFVRIDTYFYKFSLEVDAGTKIAKNLFAYFACISTIKLSLVNQEVMVYQITKQTKTSLASAATKEERQRLLQEKSEIFEALGRVYKEVDRIKNPGLPPSANLALPPSRRRRGEEEAHSEKGDS